MPSAERLDREARLRCEVRRIIADLRLYGYHDDQMRNKTIIELTEMRSRALRRLMDAPKAAA
jgi:hypothetical protein